MKAILEIIIEKVKEFFIAKMAGIMKEIGKIIILMEEVYFIMQMETGKWVILLWEKKLEFMLI